MRHQLFSNFGASSKRNFLIRVSLQSLAPMAEDLEEVTIFNSPWFNPACRANLFK